MKKRNSIWIVLVIAVSLSSLLLIACGSGSGGGGGGGEKGACELSPTASVRRCSEDATSAICNDLQGEFHPGKSCADIGITG